MLAIGRALMTNPSLLILDEATEGLAPLLRAEIWACLARLKAEGQSILLVDKHLDALHQARRPPCRAGKGRGRLDRHLGRTCRRPERAPALSAGVTAQPLLYTARSFRRGRVHAG